MRIKSLLVTLGILGSSSLALADYDRFSNRWNRHQRVDNGYQQRTTWQPLSSQLQLRRGETVDVQCNDRFARLRLQNQTGRTAVRAIILDFGNGERQRVAVSRVLVGNHDMVNIDLPGDARRIERVLVLGSSGRDGSFQLYAM